MKVPRPLQDATRRGIVVRTYDYDDGSVIAVDLGTDEDAGVDVLEDTAIVVVDGEQFEFDVPAEASDVELQNGVLTISE